ncbi:MAG: tRNA preQ1(34) S-adenosylmethionine ribosyltransferase-isomerase QueA [Nitrospinota bacterium]
MRTRDFDYELPESFIARHPLPRRDASRLLVLWRESDRLEHRHFFDLPDYLRPGDLLVLNDTQVLPWRFRAQRETSGGKVEVLLLREEAPGRFQALLRANRKVPEGEWICLGEGGPRARVGPPGGGRTLEFHPFADLRAWLRAHGEVPLPPYLKRPPVPEDRERYQTVYARREGAVAAPTAGLHFTPELLDRLEAQGVRVARLTLHVSYGTFRPVRVEDPADHRMESEAYCVPPETAEAVNAARREGGRVVAVGTTCVRALESAALAEGGRGEVLEPRAGETDLFIREGHRFRAVDALLTNFHLPRSTLLMLVAAFAGRERVLRAYGVAREMGYRFYSYGDSMLILWRADRQEGPGETGWGSWEEPGGDRRGR